ncbi:hypothetical protein M409DRAFT_38140 [Zasmidium cellare ATCC 36951]|uniref:FAD-binding FR-type domain-containing protein n=1 Tax=Zasmidium cellare ATCC 36951 TaxID=1080233 RepID=A0A6A6BXA5_ZASCE|nr:uncharacterized protein M409DRAFT_38140 [Zasmidium cellare ATCC 36951]KAF2158668.1 hypothetical protein M409DRAFT_38140 [Zasmidium cellare ATCC 36951]
MAPRDPLPAPDPLPNAIPIPAPVGDYGTQLNLTTAANPFSHGLTGVNQGLNYLFVYTLVFSFLVLLLLTLFYRWMLMVRAHLRHLLSMGREADQRYWMYNHTRFWPRVKKYLLYAPLFRNRHNQEIQLSQAVTIGTLPSRYHTILLLVYLASNAAYCLVLDWSLEHNAVIAELRGRSGVLAALNLIPTFLFMMRNNPLIPLLRVSYDTFNLLHRWCGRMVIFESIIHTIMWAVNAYEAGGSKQLGVSLETSLSYRWGMVGTAIFTFIGIVSVGPVRHAFYETFLNGHRSLVLVGMIGVYIHLDAAGLPPLPMVQVSLAFWVFEWLWRISRIIYHNASRKRGLTRVTVEWLPAEACRVTFEIRRPWKFTPGCHVHAFIPALALWSSHPFSIAWAENRPKNPPMEIEMEKLAPVEMAFTTESARRPMATSRASQYSRKSVSLAAMANAAEAAHKPEDNNLALPRESGVTTISLIVRARTGMTRKMHDKLVKQDKKPFITWGAIEGPYGGHDSLSSYGTVILFAGGVGITHMIGHINHLMLQYQTGMSSTRKILLVWSVPNTEALEWVRAWMDQILRMEGRREVLRIQLFVTKPRHRGEVVSSTGSVQMLPGRCNPETIIRREVPERIGSIGVQVCGPGAFSDAVRSACRSVVTDCSLDFIEEAFTY